VEIDRDAQTPTVAHRLATVLLVEAELARAAAFARALVTASFRVRQANDASSAASLLSRETPDLVAINLALPDVDGMVLCSLVKEALDVPILLYGPASPGRGPLLAREVGADEVLVGWPSAEELVARLDRLRRAASRRPSSERR